MAKGHNQITGLRRVQCWQLVSLITLTVKQIEGWNIPLVDRADHRISDHFPELLLVLLSLGHNFFHKSGPFVSGLFALFDVLFEQ